MELGYRFVLFELVGHQPPRAFACRTKPFTLIEAIDFQDEPVNFKVEVV